MFSLGMFVICYIIYSLVMFICILSVYVVEVYHVSWEHETVKKL